MDWWDDLWLNESFADFVALYCLREIGPKFTFKLSDFGVMSNMRKIWGYVKKLCNFKFIFFKREKMAKSQLIQSLQK